MKKTTTWGILLIVLVHSPLKTHGQTEWERFYHSTPASDGKELDLFGAAVAIDNGIAIVGAPAQTNSPPSTLDDENVTTGAAYIYEENSNEEWTESQKIKGSDSGADDAFGKSVAILGNYAFVGAPHHDSSTTSITKCSVLNDVGAVYVFKRANNVWEEVQKLMASDVSEGSNFGFSIDLYADIIVIGAPYKSDMEIQNIGAVYIFEKDNSGLWIETQKIVSPNPQEKSLFGYNMAISDQHLLIGQPYEKYIIEIGDPEKTWGAVYAYNKQNSLLWKNSQRLIANQEYKYRNSNFGISMDISNNKLIIGESQYSSGGRAILYEYTTDWQENLKLKGYQADGIKYANVGAAVAIEDGISSTTIWFTDPNGSMKTNAFQISYIGWSYVNEKLHNGRIISEGVSNGNYTGNHHGVAIAMKGKYCIIGANPKKEHPIVFGDVPSEHGETPFDEIDTRGRIQILRRDQPALSTFNANNDSKFNVYPNPNNGKFVIRLKQKAPKVTLNISDATGKLLYTSNYENVQSIPVTLDIKSGMYLINIKTASKNQTVKLVKN